MKNIYPSWMKMLKFKDSIFRGIFCLTSMLLARLMAEMISKKEPKKTTLKSIFSFRRGIIHTFQKKYASLLLCCILGILGACKDNSSPQPSEKTLIIGTSADNPPFEFLQNGKIVGFDVALIEEIGKQLGMDIKIQDMNFDGILGSLVSGRIQGAIAGISATEERKKNMDFTIPYYTTGISMVTLKKDNLTTIESLANKNIGSQAGSTYAMYANGPLSQQVQNLTVKHLPRIPELVQDLKVNRISAIIIGTKEAHLICKENLDMGYVEINSDPGFSIALPKNSPLTEKMNKIITDLQQNGKINQFKAQWLES